jgi:hypothetical protein
MEDIDRWEDDGGAIPYVKYLQYEWDIFWEEQAKKWIEADHKLLINIINRPNPT